MEFFKCKYLNHENEEIIGFCLNQNCQNATQYCYECLTTTHLDHLNDCIRFSKLNQYINELIQVQNQQSKQYKEISKSLQYYFEQIFKIMEQDITILDKMKQQLQNKEYLNFKAQIKIIKRFYSKEKENQIQQQIIQLNNILQAIKNMVIELTKSSDYIISGDQDLIKIEEINQESEEQKENNIKEAKRLLDQGLALDELNKYQEAIECYDKAISINPKYDKAWNNKGFALYSLNKCQEAIECYDKAISINPKYDAAWNNKGLALRKLNKYQEAIECYDKAISINPKNDNAWNNKGFALRKLNKYQEAIECYDKAISINPKHDKAWSQKGYALHQLQKYNDAISCYDQALSININSLRLQRKADSLFELGKKSEAKQLYLSALEKGSNDKNYIQRQLSKL